MPAVFGPADTLAVRGFPPDTLAARPRPRLAAGAAAVAPVVDGDLGEWRLVRWSDLAGAPALVAGAWDGPADYALRFALQWTRDGLFLGARLRDDHPSSAAGPLQALEGVTLAVASGSPVVQRAWMGGARRFRVRLDGRLEAATDLRNRRQEAFAATALGARAAVRRTVSVPGCEIELFVPWTALYPALPGTPADLLANVFLDDIDGGVTKTAAWATRPAGARRAAAWATLDLGGELPGGALAVLATRHPEAVAEWCIVPRRGAAASGTIEVRAAADAPPRWQIPPAGVPGRGPYFVRLYDLPRGARRLSLALQLPGEPAARFELAFLPEAEVLGRVAAAESAAADGPAAFPSDADVRVRLARAHAAAAALGDWHARRYHATGILAYRAAVLEEIETLLAEADLLGAARGLPPDSLRARLGKRWPRLGLGNIPAGSPFLRGFRSRLDGSVQPYAVFVPESAAPGCPLLVVLHDLDQDEGALFETTALAAQCAARGWVAVCPFGRGDSGYLTAGERDVLEALAAARASLPVDGKRLYLTGHGMGGTGTWLLALRHPDLFAAASIVSGYGDLDQAGLFEGLQFQPAEHAWYDAHNPVRLVRAGPTTAFRIAHGERDAIVSPVHARILHARFEELGIAHGFRLDPTGEHGGHFFDDDLQASLDFLGAHVRAADGVENSELFAAVGPPVVDFFARGPFAVIWGTRQRAPEPGSPLDAAVGAALSDRAAAGEFAAVWRRRGAGTATVLPDTAVTPELLRTTDLVLVGDPTTNVLLERWADRLPVRYDPDAFLVGGTAYPFRKFGIVYAAANPEFPGRTIVVLSGMQGRLDLVPRSPVDIAADYAVVGDQRGLVDLGLFPR